MNNNFNGTSSGGFHSGGLATGGDLSPLKSGTTTILNVQASPDASSSLIKKRVVLTADRNDFANSSNQRDELVPQ
jgi:hypothetical protein